MKIGGLQKVSTIDYPGEISCVVFLWGCNFRCGFCHNPELVLGEVDYGVSEDEFFDFLSRRVGKLDAVVISGGEPLISLDVEFVRRIKGMGFKVKVDTNGSFPERLRELVNEGLVDYLAMDVKGAREDYAKICGIGVDIKKIEESMRIVDEFSECRSVRVEGCNSIPHKSEGSATRSVSCGHSEGEYSENRKFRGEFRTTVVPGLHDLERVRGMGVWMGEVLGRKAGRIFLQGFKVGIGNLIDEGFVGKGDFDEGELRWIAEGVKDLFGEVGVRV